MKHYKQATDLRLYHASTRKYVNRLLTQKTMDIVVMIVSCAGLVSAIAFLLTMN